MHPNVERHASQNTGPIGAEQVGKAENCGVLLQTGNPAIAEVEDDALAGRHGADAGMPYSAPGGYQDALLAAASAGSL